MNDPSVALLAPDVADVYQLTNAEYRNHGRIISYSPVDNPITYDRLPKFKRPFFSSNITASARCL